MSEQQQLSEMQRPFSCVQQVKYIFTHKFMFISYHGHLSMLLLVSAHMGTFLRFFPLSVLLGNKSVQNVVKSI